MEPLDSILIKRAIISNEGNKKINPKKEKIMSNNLLIILYG